MKAFLIKFKNKIIAATPKEGSSSNELETLQKCDLCKNFTQDFLTEVTIEHGRTYLLCNHCFKFIDEYLNPKDHETR